jgi:hypothetical protein
MNKSVIVFLVTVSCAALAGCDQQDVNCSAPKSQSQRSQCAHKASTESRGPDTLPANPKKW